MTLNNKSHRVFLIINLVLTLFLSVYLRSVDAWAAESLTLKVLATFEGGALTSRENVIQNWVRESLSQGVVVNKLKDDDFRESLLEALVEKEANRFRISQVSEDEAIKAFQKIKGSWKTSTALTAYEAQEKELIVAVRRQLVAARFLKFKTETFEVDIPDLEVQKYFNENPKKFVGSTFTAMKPDIVVFLKKQQLETKLSDWVESLKKKYQLRILS